MREPGDGLQNTLRNALRAARRGARRHRARFAADARAHLRAGLFLATSLPAGVLWSLLLLSLAATGTALAAALVGLPVLALAVLSGRLAAAAEHRRAGRMLGVEVPSPGYPSVDGRGLVRALRWALVPALPRELAYVLLLPALGVAELAVVAFAFFLSIPLATYPLWASTMAGEPLALAPSVALGTLTAWLGLPLVRHSAGVHARLARGLLGPSDGRLGLGAAVAASGSAVLTALAAAVGLGLAVVLAVQASQLDLGTLWAALTSPEEVRAFFEGFGAWAPAVFLAVQAAQVVVSVVPAGPLTLVGVAAFGPWWGFALSLVGAFAGSLAAFLLGRRFGRPMVARLVGEEVLERRAGEMDPRGRWVLATLLVPLPVGGDAVCALAGLSGFPLGRFALLVLAGRMLYTALAVLLASGAMSGTGPALLACIAAALLVAAGALAYLAFRARPRAPDTTNEEPPAR